MSDTPRTDAYYAKKDSYKVADADFARQLERELAVALEALLGIAAPTWGEGKHPKAADEALDRVMAMRRAYEEGQK